MNIRLTPEPINADVLTKRVARPGNGGICTFHGIVRDNMDGRPVVKLEYEAFEPMALQELDRIVRQVEERWGLTDVEIEHRVGELQIGEASVVIAVGAPHRAEAFEACRYIIDTLKTTVPIWKKEWYRDGRGVDRARIRRPAHRLRPARRSTRPASLRRSAGRVRTRTPTTRTRETPPPRPGPPGGPSGSSACVPESRCSTPDRRAAAG